MELCALLVVRHGGGGCYNLCRRSRKAKGDEEHPPRLAFLSKADVLCGADRIGRPE